ncbi:hypothetical protein BT69DRAFT_1283358 [Atractiella rhizophila]|nr:hypothetical protein BT69DRAFT_1283358 [Atractiella rhizophila]
MEPGDGDTVSDIILAASSSLRKLRLFGLTNPRPPDGFYAAVRRCEHLTWFTTDFLIQTTTLPASLTTFEWEVNGPADEELRKAYLREGLRFISGMILNSNVKTFLWTFASSDWKTATRRFTHNVAVLKSKGVECYSQNSTHFKGTRPRIVRRQLL